MRNMLVILLIITLLTGGMIRAQDSACRFTGTLDTLALYHAPLSHQIQLKDQLPGGTAYRVTASHGQHFLVAVDDAYGGWVDRRSGVLSGACDSVPVDATPLAEFPTICLFTSQQTVPGYDDATLSSLSPLGSVPANTTFTTGTRTPTAYEIIFDHAASVWVASHSGQLSGAGCLFNGQIAYAGENARMWSHPDVRVGRVLTTLAPGSEVMIAGNFFPGPIRLDTDEIGLWVPVHQGNFNGWVWQERLTIPPATPPANPTLAVTRPNARLWSQPDARSGQLLTTLADGITVSVIAGPVQGPIRTDTADQGDWVQVRVPFTGQTGWVWAERLTFE